MRFVLDASVATAGFFEDGNIAVADAAFDLTSADGEALAPLLFWFELRNAILPGMRRNRVIRERATGILARRRNLTFYDAICLELAQRNGIPLATPGRVLARAASAEGAPMIGVSAA